MEEILSSYTTTSNVDGSTTYLKSYNRKVFKTSHCITGKLKNNRQILTIHMMRDLKRSMENFDIHGKKGK